MPYRFKPGRMYRIPTHFGPTTGPRQGERGRKFANKDPPKVTRRSISFLTNRGQLEELLPEGLKLGAEPVVTVSASYISEIEWLAGRRARGARNWRARNESYFWRKIAC